GGGFALVRTADGHATAIDYRETAPAAATADRFLRDGKPDPALTRTGGLAVAVPGEGAGWVALHDRFGRAPRGGGGEPAPRSLLPGADDTPRGPSHRIVQPDLATPLERVGRRGIDGFLAPAATI